jgi:uncharacterized protein (TIGR02145 family)
MDRKMNFIRFCRWSLSALSIFLLFSACDKILPPSGNGVDIPVKIRAVSIAGGAQNETITRAGGESRIVGEPVIQDLGDGMLAEITVEEDLSALRVGDKSLTPNAWFRIIAIKSSDNTYLSHADFQAKTGDGYYTDDNLHVPSDMVCDFICFSYNSTTASLPAVNYTVGATLPTHSMDGSTDFLYQRLTSQTISADNPSLAFDNLWHQLAKVSLVFNTSYNKWPITAVNPNALPTIGSLAIPSAFTLTNDTPPSGSATTQSFTGWPATPSSTEVSSGELRVVPKTGSLTLTIPQGAIRVSGSSYTSQPTAEKTYTITVTLEKGKSYTVRIKPYVPKFAGSNIYWDSANSKLTFDTDNATNTLYQGVYFKWGSLIGVSPVGAYSSNASTGTVLYWPDDVTNRTWKVVRGGTSWSNIPYYAAESAYGTGEKTLLNNSTTANFNAYKGDICNYINPAYRMPTLDELAALGTGTSSADGEYTWTGAGNATSADATGKQVFNQYGTFKKTGTEYVLPASGFRSYSSGTVNFAGSAGYYWSGSSENSSEAYGSYFDSSRGASAVNGDDRRYGYPVRCVLN